MKKSDLNDKLNAIRTLLFNRLTELLPETDGYGVARPKEWSSWSAEWSHAASSVSVWVNSDGYAILFRAPQESASIGMINQPIDMMPETVAQIVRGLVAVAETAPAETVKQ